MIITLDVTDTIQKYGIMTKKSGKVFGMENEVFETANCSFSVREVLFTKTIIT